MLKFDGTITLGAIISAATILATGILLLQKVNILLGVHRDMIDALKGRFSQHESENREDLKQIQASIRSLVETTQVLVGAFQVGGADALLRRRKEQS